MEKLAIITRLCDEDEEGKITTIANLATLRVCRNKASMAMLLCCAVE
jgi:hypothetical protein